MSHEGKHPYERNDINLIADLNSYREGEEVLNGLEAMVEEVNQRNDLTPAREWLKGLINWARCVKGYQEQVERATFSTKETNIAEEMKAIAGEGIDLIRLASRGKRIVDVKQLEGVAPLDERLDRSIALIEEMQQAGCHDPALKFVKETIQLASVRVRGLDSIVPQSLRQIAQRLRSRTGEVVTMSEVIDTIEALPDSIQRHRDLLGRGLTTPQVTYDPIVNEVRQYIENLQATQGYLGQADMPDHLGDVIDYMQAHLKWLTEVQYNRKPVLDLKKIAEIMRDWVEAESLASHVKFDMVNMIESLDMVIAQHIGEDLPVSPSSEELRSRMGWAIEALDDATKAHPLDINQDKLKEVLLWLREILSNNRGYHNLGKEGYIVVPTAENVTADVIDSIRGYLISYGQGEHMASDLRSMAALRGDLSISNMPEWFASTWGHTSKGGFASLIYHTMTEVAAQEKPKAIHLSSAELGKLEEEIRNGNPMALINHINTVTETESND